MYLCPMSQDISSGIIKLGISEYYFGTEIAQYSRSNISTLQTSADRPELATFARCQRHLPQIQAGEEDTGVSGIYDRIPPC